MAKRLRITIEVVEGLAEPDGPIKPSEAYGVIVPLVPEVTDQAMKMIGHTLELVMERHVES